MLYPTLQTYADQSTFGLKRHRERRQQKEAEAKEEGIAELKAVIEILKKACPYTISGWSDLPVRDRSLFTLRRENVNS